MEGPESPQLILICCQWGFFLWPKQLQTSEGRFGFQSLELLGLRKRSRLWRPNRAINPRAWHQKDVYRVGVSTEASTKMVRTLPGP